MEINENNVKLTKSIMSVSVEDNKLISISDVDTKISSDVKSYIEVDELEISNGR